MTFNRNGLNYKRKNSLKIISSILQLVILCFLSFIFVREVFYVDKYQSIDASAGSNNKGFVALSYFGVDRNGSTKYISKKDLEKQLTILKNQGFKTISQQQVIDFYKNGTPLPEKALFLSFEDGRNDSSIFAQNSLERLNYKATMFTYANKMNTTDTKFLKPNHLLGMVNSGYWELGTNGYRLTYINVFNGEGKHLGVIDENEVPNKTEIEYYNHYLMDYLKDNYLIPIENRSEMEERIARDYNLMKSIYTEELGYMPKAYSIMHANTLYYKMNPHVEQVNDEQIKEKFTMHFNRELNSYNSANEELYNLTRLQVAPYWPTNHLLMKVKSDSNLPIEFYFGDENIAKDWSIKNGVAEFTQNLFVLTSNPSKEATMSLKENIPIGSKVQFSLKGNVVGKQNIYLKNNDGISYLKITLVNNELVVSEKVNLIETTIGTYKLDGILWNKGDFAFNKATEYDYWDTQQGSRIAEDEYPSNLKNNRHFTLQLTEDALQMQVDKNQDYSVKLSQFKPDSTLQLSFGGTAISQDTSNEQYRDTIYDSIVGEFSITFNDEPIYTIEPSGLEKSKSSFTKIFNNVTDFFIETF